MAKRSRKPVAPAALVEWVGGTVSLPATITGEGESYRPGVLLWIVPAERLVLGTTVAPAEELPGLVGASLRDAIADPAADDFGPPTRLRVATDDLAHALRTDFPDLEIDVAPTPEIDDAGAELAAVAAEGALDSGWLADGLSAGAVGGFFDAMAALWRAAPWESVPDDDALFRITVEALDVHDAVAVVIGQMGESHGVLLFDGVEDRDRFAAFAEAMRDGDMEAAMMPGGGSSMPAHIGLSFDPADETMPIRLEERDTHGWALADELAFPSLLCFGENLRERSPTPKDLTLAEALARAFATVADDEGFEAARFGGGTIERTLRVPTHGGEIEVRLSAPVDDEAAIPRRDPDAIPERVYRLKIELERQVNAVGKAPPQYPPSEEMLGEIVEE